MYPGKYAVARAEQPAFIMARNGRSGDLRRIRAPQQPAGASAARQGLRRLDHYAIFMENNNRYVESCGAGERSGLYFTCVNSYLTAEELAYILDNSQSKILITSMARREVALAALEKCPRIELCLVVDGGDGKRVRRSRQATSAAFPVRRSPTKRWARRCSTPPARPVGRKACCARCRSIRRPGRCRCSSSCTSSGDTARAMIYLSPAPLYHSRAAGCRRRSRYAYGGTAVIMERFDPERLPAADRKVQGHAQPARADHVLAHVEAS